MAIKPYKEGDQDLYLVTANVRSKQNREIRVQKSRGKIKSLSEAKKIEKALIRDALEELSRRENRAVQFGNLVDDWELALRNGVGASRSLTPQTQQDYITVLRTFTQHWWNLPVDQITPADVRDVLANIHTQNLSRARQQRVKTSIDGVFKWGIETRKIKNVFVSPAKGVSLVGRVEEKRPEILNINEIRLLLAKAKEMDHRWYPVWAVALLTGCRAGELYALTWNDIDFESKKIIISKSFNKRIRQIGPTKAGYWREVPMNEQLEALLKELKLKRGTKNSVLPHQPEWSSYQQAAVLRQFCEEIGIPSIKFHALRACFATQLIKDGVAPSVVMKVCGWKDLKTMQCYVRMAGIETEGATNSLKIMPENVAMGRVMELFSSGQ